MRAPRVAPALDPRIEILFRELPGAGRPPDLDRPGTGWVAGRAGSGDGGTEAVFYLRLDPAREVVTEARFQALGCPHTLAVAAWLTQRATGQGVAALPPAGGVRGWAAALGVPVERLGRLLVVEDAFRAALTQARVGSAAGGAAAS